MIDEARSNSRTLVLRSSRRKWFGVLAISATFALGGVLMINDGAPMGWFVAGFFGLGAVVAIVTLVLPARLEIDADGMTLTQLWRRTRFDFEECSEFRTWSTPLAVVNTVVVFDYESSDRPRLARASVRLSGANSALPDTFGLKASALAELLNKRRRDVSIDPDRSAPG